MPSFTMDGTTIFSKSGSDITYANGTLGSGTIFPAGHVVKTYTAGYFSTTLITATMATGGSTSNPDNLTHDVMINTNNRVFVKLIGKTVNITSGNGVIVYGWVGFGSQTQSNKGAWGCVFKVPDALGNNRAYQGGNYPLYTASSVGSYPQDWSGVVYVGTGGTNTNDTIGTGDIEIALYAFAYNESGASSSQTCRVYRAQIVIQEIQL